MKQLLDKFRDRFTSDEEETPQVRHRAAVVNDVIRQGRKPRPVHKPEVRKERSDDPRIAFIQERNEIVSGADPYNSSDFDRADSWKYDGDR